MTTSDLLITVANDGSSLLGFATGVVFWIYVVYLIFDR